MLFLHFTCAILMPLVLSFNVDYEYTVLKNGPPNSLFGFSVTEHHERSNKWLLVGAPLANNTHLGISVLTPGTIFKCSAVDPSVSCTTEVKFDQGQSDIESKNNEWLGVSLKSQGKDKAVFTCAHRYMSYGSGKNYRLYEGRCFGVKLEDGVIQSINPCGNINANSFGKTINHDGYGQCETGIAMDLYPKLTPSEGVDGIYGSVGALTFTGQLFSKDTEEDEYHKLLIDNTKTAQSSYFGYSIALGNYFEKSVLSIASGGPRYKSYGKIQIASGFGIVLCSLDTDNNGYSELIVGAPFYSNLDERDRPDQGIVYVYHKPEGKDTLELQLKLESGKEKSNFGYAVGNAGDLNQDGYKDLVVGAPHENERSGAIYIFQGSNKGLLEKFTQHIEASKVLSGLSDNLGLKGFGRSVSGGMDMDGNKYDDILVGSYISNQAVLLRSRPVVYLNSTMGFAPSEVNIAVKDCRIDDMDGVLTTCFKMNFCHVVSEVAGSTDLNNNVFTIRYTIIADPIPRPRVLFADTKSNTIIIYMKTSISIMKCQNIALYLVYNEDGGIAEYPDITFSVKHELAYGDSPNDNKKPARSNTLVPSLDGYPVLRQRFQNGKVSSAHRFDINLKFQRGCTTCIPDLSIASDHNNYTIRLGAKNFRLNITLQNKGADPGFSLGLKLNLPTDLELDHIVIKNQNVFCTKNVCDDIINKFKKDETEEIGVVLKTSQFTPTSPNNITLTVTSANSEDSSTLFDNKLDITFDVKVVADIQMLAVVSTQNVVYLGKIKGESVMTSLEDVGQLVEHKYAVRNNGPDLLPKANVTIDWPYEAVSGKHLLYLVDIVTTSSNVVCTTLGRRNELNLGGDQSLSFNQNTRARRSVDGDNTTTIDAPDTDSVKDKNSGTSRIRNEKVLTCSTGQAKCIRISCIVEQLEKDQTSSISIVSRLWEPSLVLDYYGEPLTIASYGTVVMGINATYISDPNLSNNFNDLYTFINPEAAPKAKTGGLKVWQIALAITAGIILLALLIFGLYKVGFFKRNRFGKSKKDEKKLLKNGK